MVSTPLLANQLDFIARRSLAYDKDGRIMDAETVRLSIEEEMRVGDMNSDQIEFILWNLEQHAIHEYVRVNKRMPGKQ